MSLVQSMKARTAPVAVEFSELTLVHKLVCVGELAVGYVLPIAGIIAFFVLRWRANRGLNPTGAVYRFFPMAGVVAALVWYVVECIMAGGVVL